MNAEVPAATRLRPAVLSIIWDRRTTASLRPAMGTRHHVSHSKEHIWPQWIRKQPGNLPAERFKLPLA